MPKTIVAKLHLFRQFVATVTFRRRVVRHRYGQCELAVVLADPTSALWYDCDWPEPREIQELAHTRLKTGALVINAGAHQGVIAMMLAKRVGSAGAVIAVELSKHNATLAQANLRANGIANVHVIRAAVGESAGAITTVGRLNGRVASSLDGNFRAKKVEAVTIDALAQRFGVPDVLYIDVEGYEWHVLRGAREVLRSGPDCFIEMHAGCGLEQFGVRVEQVFALLREAQFTLYAARQEEQFQPVERCDETLFRERFYLLAKVEGRYSANAMSSKANTATN